MLDLARLLHRSIPRKRESIAAASLDSRFRGNGRGWLTAALRGLAGAGALFAASFAEAEAPAGYQPIYASPTRVNMGGRPVTADIALYADLKAAKAGDLRLALVTDVTDFIADVEKDLEKWVATHQERCGQRWAAGKPLIEFPTGAIRFALDIEFEIWTCGWNGEAEPSMLALETGSVDVTLNPFIDAGKLQASLGDFAIDNRSGVSKYLPLEFVLGGILEQEIKNLNLNPKFYKAPKPLIEEGFVYEAIRGDRNAEGRVIITARYKAQGPAAKLKTLADRVRAEGISSEGVKQ